MNGELQDYVLTLLIALLPLAAMILAITAFVSTRRLKSRLRELEDRLLFRRNPDDGAPRG